MSLRLLLLNLHHSKLASAALFLRLADGGAHLVPWVVGGKVAGLGAKECNECLTLKKASQYFPLCIYSNGDNTEVSLELHSISIKLFSAYMTRRMNKVWQ